MADDGAAVGCRPCGVDARDVAFGVEGFVLDARREGHADGQAEQGAAQGEDTVLGVCHGVWLREVGEYLYDGALGVGAAFFFNTPKVRTFAIY